MEVDETRADDRFAGTSEPSGAKGLPAFVLTETSESFEPLLVTKLSPPTSAAQAIDRPRVMKYLDTDPGPLLTLLNAPAGYGKTTLMAAFYARVRERQGKAAWLTLDEMNRDGKVFLAYLIAALERGGVDMADFQSAVRTKLRQSNVHLVRTALINHLAEVPGDIHVFLDEFERVGDSQAADLVRFILTYAPANLHFVIASRTAPALSIGVLRGRGQVCELTAQQLRFDADDVEAYFGHDCAEAEAISRRCEGWPAALQMSRLWLELRPSDRADAGVLPDIGVAELGDYLMEQVFSGLPEDLRADLMRIAVADRFDDALAGALTGRPNGGAIIAEIRERNLFLNAHQEQKWFFFHQLFRSFLLEQLQSERSADVAALHVAASRYFLSLGQNREAIDYACRASDPAWMQQMLRQLGGWYGTVHQGIYAYMPLLEWVERHPGKVLEAERVATYIHLQTGEVMQARLLFDQIAGSDAEAEGAGLDLSTRILDQLVGFYEDKRLDPEEISALHDAIEGDDLAATYARTVTSALVCYAAYHLGEFEKCIELGRKAVHVCKGLSGYYALIYIHLFITLTLIAMGRLSEARRAADDVRSMIVRHFGAQADLMALADTLLAEIAYHQSQPESATALLAPSFETVLAEGWFDVVLAANRTAAALQMDQDGDEESLLPAISSGALPIGDTSRASRAICAIEAHSLIAENRLDEARRLLQTAARGDTDGDWRLSDMVEVTRAELMIAQGRLDEAVATLAPRIEAMLKGGRLLAVLGALIVNAHALFRSDRIDEAREQLLQAFSLACPQKIFQPFIHLGRYVAPMLDLVEEADDGQYSLLAEEIRKHLAYEREEPVSALSELSPREREVLELLATGMSNKEIARVLMLAEGTVKVHRKRLYRKLDASSRYKALESARMRGMLGKEALAGPMSSQRQIGWREGAPGRGPGLSRQ